MVALNEAWHTLSDPGRRAAYDAWLREQDRTSAATSSVAFRPRTETFTIEDSPVPYPHARVRRWPAAALMLIAAMAVIFVFSAYALHTTEDPAVAVLGRPIEIGDCAVVRPGPIAIPVPCDRPHYGRVRAFVARGLPCPIGTEGYGGRDRPDLACLRVGT